MKITMQPNEQVIKASDTTLLDNKNSIAGKLILTNQRIYFKAEPNGSHHDDIAIEPSDIRDVMLFNDRMFFPQGLSIITNEKENKFRIKNREAWSKMIVKMF